MSDEAQKPFPSERGSSHALAKLAEIPDAGSKERDFWLEAPEQHGFTAPGESALPTLWMASEAAVLTLMSEARKQGQRDVLGIVPSPDLVGDGADQPKRHFRQGRRVPRNVYRDDLEPLFMAATDELAAELVMLLNAGADAIRAALATGGARHG